MNYLNNFMKNIKQVVYFKSSPHEVYEALMDSKKHSAFTGGDVKVSRKIGGKMIMEEAIEGININLVQDKKIVQKWRYIDWPKGHYSKATFIFEKSKDGTRLTFIQERVPDDKYEDIYEGWIEYYWRPLKEFLEK